ncbi:MAG: hypothetical protein ACPGO3_00275 [Magnetospiraceae bacterium]
MSTDALTDAARAKRALQFVREFPDYFDDWLIRFADRNWPRLETYGEKTRLSPGQMRQIDRIEKIITEKELDQ